MIPHGISQCSKNVERRVEEEVSEKRNDAVGSVHTVGDGHRALYEVVIERVRAAILSGDFFPGERLVEDRLAQELKVSRHPVREALRTLQLEGLVEISPRRGATVSRVTVEEAGEFFQVLAVLDGLAARLAAKHRDENALRTLRSILDGAKEFQAAQDLEALTRLNREFHSIVASAANNRHLTETITRLRDRIQWVQAAVARRRPDLSWSEHEQIYAAIESRDEVAAESVATSHIEAARATYLSHRTGTGR